MNSIIDVYFNNYLQESSGGQVAGVMELTSTSLEDARIYAEQIFKRNGRLLDDEIPDFDINFIIAQKKAKMGYTKRRDMPVISTNDVRDLQNRLKKGSIDIKEPFAPTTDPNNPFPQGLSGEQAKVWLNSGFYDGSVTDDIINASIKKIKANQLIPIQQQIYFDKSIESISKKGNKISKNYLREKSIFITSSDNRIIDGHHRFLSAMLLDPKMTLTCFAIDLPINILLPLSLAYGDAIGNKRNT